MIYLAIVILLFVSEIFYFRIANAYNIVDKPNERSSHTKVTLRGGGIIYWIVSLLYFAMYFSNFSIYFFIASTIVACVSFIDDVKGLSQIHRLISHLIAITLIFYSLTIFSDFSLWIVVLGYLFFIGIINAYNFMDGINGITGLYSIAVLLSLQYVNLYKYEFVNPDFIWYPILASVVFLFFNFRKKAKCFAGDIGSITIAFWVVTLLLMLMIETQNFIWIGFLAVYGVDTVMTILHRLYIKQNIFEAHRLHFYQILANEKGIDHRMVSVGYFFVQLICSFIIVKYYALLSWKLLVVILSVLVIIYLYKFRILNKQNLKMQ